MKQQQALCWLKQVDGTVFHNKKEPEGDNAWVAVVRTPSAPGRAGKIIMAFGETLETAAIAAESEWDKIWGGLGRAN